MYQRITNESTSFSSTTIVVNEISAAIQILNAKQIAGQNITYVHGLFKDVMNQISELDKDGLQKYPTIALLQDFEEEISHSDVIMDLRFIIIRGTLKEYTASQRYENNFIPYLYPIFNDLMNALEIQGFIGIECSKIDRVSVGMGNIFKDTGLSGNEYIDALEINFKCKINKNKCVK